MGENKIVARTYPAGTPRWVRDATPNDSDKSFTVPAGKVWALNSIYAEMIATATIGSRSLAATISNGTNVIYMEATATFTAGQKANLNLINGQSRSTTATRMLDGSTANISVSGPLASPLLLPAGYILHFWDTTAVDPAADDMTVVLYYEELDV